MVGRERESVAEVLRVLGEFDKRKLHQRSHPSCFEYCTKVLGYSEDEAYRRIHAARAGLKFPSVVTAIERGEVTLTAVNLLWPHMTSENYRTLLKRAKGKSRRELEAIVAALTGRPPRRDVIRVVAAEVPLVLDLPAEAASDVRGPHTGPDPDPIPTRYRVEFDADPELVAKIEQLKALLSHKYPNGDLAAILSEIVDEALERREAELRKEGPIRESDPDARRIPAWVRRAVWRRDDGRCTYVGADGQQCGSRFFVQMDHIIPWSLGGVSNDPANIRLLCGTHNRSAARAAGLPVPPGLKEKAENTPDTPRGQEAQNGMGPSPAPA